MYAVGWVYLNLRAVVSIRSPQKIRKQVHHVTTHLLICFKQKTSGAHSGLFSGGLWSRLGPSHKESDNDRKVSSRASSSRGTRRRDDAESDGADEDNEEEDDSQLQKIWGAMIKQKEQQTNKMKKSRLDNLPSLQIEISRDSSDGSDSDS